jgi:hypothetical protein
MIKKGKLVNITVSCISLFILIASTLIPSVLGDIEAKYHEGFSQGVTWKPFVPMKKTTFIDFDEESLIDDYAYLSAIPTSVFYDKDNDKLYSSPLLFYKDKYYPNEDWKRTLDSRQGIDYFMEDWMGYSGTLDQLTLINVDKNDMDTSWSAKEIDIINGDDPFSIASSIALNQWSYSDNAVLAVIQEEYEKPDNSTNGVLTGTVPVKDVKKEHFEVPQTNEVYPQSYSFNVPEGYKYITVRSWYPSFYFEAGLPGFEGIINMTIPAGDRDLQIYCKYEGELMMAAITNEWNAQSGMDVDKTSAYVYKSGEWSVAVTDVPTKDTDLYTPFEGIEGEKLDTTDLEVQKHRSFFTFHFGRYGTFLEVLRSMKQVMYQVDIEMYPGIEIEIPESPPYGCRDAQFNLTWNDDNVDLGFSLIGPAGEEVLSTKEPGVSKKCGGSVFDEGVAFPPGTENDLHVNQLGELQLGENYKICVFAMNEIQSPVDFELTYSWKQNYSEEEGAGLASATEAAVLASELNAPLLYISPDTIPDITFDALYELGVEDLYIVNIDDYLSDSAKEKLNNGFSIMGHYTTYEKIYKAIRMISKSNDIIFTSIDSWTYWYTGRMKPEGEQIGAIAIGPAAYIAAHHGAPVLITDNHKELSSSLVWHTEFWRRHPDGFSKLPTVSEMYLTGARVYDFLKELDYDEEGEETLITVAGQFEIGLTWDRVFVGKSKTGRFMGSPVDLAVWIVKNVFYPMIVFENPAIDNQAGVTVINGSSSKRRFPWRGSLGLKITKPSGEETMKYPVLDTFVCYDIKFNSRASKYWGFTYECADGQIPGESSSSNLIDEGVMVAVNGQVGGFEPDLSGSEVQPFYLNKGGYSPVYSTSFEANMYNLNQGVLLWLVNTHGASINGGMFMFWDVKWENPSGAGYPPIPLAAYNKETNPWRGYEWLLGSTEEPDTMTMDIHGVFPTLAGNPEPIGPRFMNTGVDWALAKRPIRDIIGDIASLPIIRFLAPDWLEDTQDYYDGVVITVLLGRFGTSWYNGTQIDDELGNIHSVGISSVACLPAGKYLHLALMRHGSPFQIMDPWATSWYSDVWQNKVPRGIALGETIGQIYMEGIKKVGIQYVRDGPPKWWWDLAENVCLYGDPDLRVWVPSTEFSSNNHWEAEDIQPLKYNSNQGFDVNGHTPFGASSHPNRKEPTTIFDQYMIVFIALILIVILIITTMVINKKRSIS